MDSGLQAECLRRARNAQLYDLVQRTALDHAPRLSARLGTRLYLKREDQQLTFSFKLRGAYHCLRQLRHGQLARGVVAASAGNHAQGVALAARELGVTATIFMPRTTPEIKVEAVRALDAEIIQHGDHYDAACAAARARARRDNAWFVHPFDDPEVVAGQATLGLELTEQLDRAPEAVFVPIGGGGLAAGVATAVKSVWPDVRVIGVEPVDAASMKAALAAGHPVDIGHTGMFADGVAVRRVGRYTHALCREVLDDIVLVSVDQVCAAVRTIFEEVRALPEPAGALAVAGAVRYAEDHQPQGDWVAVISGANVNFDRLGHMVERCALGDGSEVLLSVKIPERPGSFLEFCRALGESSVTEFNYRFSGQQDARVFVGVRLREQSATLMERLAGQAYDVTDLSDNEVAKLHLRHVVGGCLPSSERERLFRFEFPERPGALLGFLNELAGRWSISLFHYRNHGAAQARVLAGFLVPASDDGTFRQFLRTTGYYFVDESDNPAYREFLAAPPAIRAIEQGRIAAL